MTKLYSILTIFLLISLSSMGQNQNGQITGFVQDERGISISDLSIALKGIKVGAKTDEKGFFKIINLSP